MHRIVMVALLMSAMLVTSAHAQDEDLCTREAVVASFAKATDMTAWSQQYSTCSSQVQRAIRTLASGYQLLSTEFLPFAAADNPNTFSPIWKWYAGSASSYSIDPTANMVYLVAGNLTDQRDDITTAPVLAYPVVGDVTAQVKLTFTALDEKNGAGIGIRGRLDTNSWIRITRVGESIEVAATTRGKTTVVDSRPYDELTQELYLKIERSGDVFTLSYSVNGDDWEEITSDSNAAFPDDTEVFLTTFWPVENAAAQALFSEVTITE